MELDQALLIRMRFLARRNHADDYLLFVGTAFSVFSQGGDMVLFGQIVDIAHTYGDLNLMETIDGMSHLCYDSLESEKENI